MLKVEPRLVQPKWTKVAKEPNNAKAQQVQVRLECIPRVASQTPANHDRGRGNHWLKEEYRHPKSK